MYLYTNEHVIREGFEAGHEDVFSHPDEFPLGRVVLTSGHGLDNKDDAAMTTYGGASLENLEFMTDWAIIKMGPNKPDHFNSSIPEARRGTNCRHIQGVSHVPKLGRVKAVARGAGDRSECPLFVQHPAIVGEFNSGPIPTRITAGLLGLTKDRTCWQLAASEGEGYNSEQWNRWGLGIGGDSGAGVVDCATGQVCGLIFGRQMTGTAQHVLILDMKDVLEDTKAKARAYRHLRREFPDFDTAELTPCKCT